jgi:fatty acid desaturase
MDATATVSMPGSERLDEADASPIYRAAQPALRRAERALERVLRLEHAANIFPLVHVVCYYTLFFCLAWRGLVETPWLRLPLWVVLVLLNFSLSIGIMHMHAHRKLFTDDRANRVLEFLLSLPCCLSYPVMLYTHVYLHHRYDDGEGDPTSTDGKEGAFAAVWYWLRYADVTHRATIRGLFARDASSRWRKLRRHYIVDSSAVLAIIVVYGWIDPVRMLLIYLLPLTIVSTNIGFFAWLTHAPAFRKSGVNASINNVNNWMNLLVHNQGFHAVHHAYPGIHWTMIPSRAGLMRDIDPSLIVPYWVTLPAALRILRPRSFRDAAFGAQWKRSYEAKSRERRYRLGFLPYFVWV